MSITYTEVGFQLPCQNCLEKFLVDGTAKFRRTNFVTGEPLDGNFEYTAYWYPGHGPKGSGERPANPVGVSNGKGDSFVCTDCIALKLKPIREWFS